MRRYALALEITTPEMEDSTFLTVTDLSEPKRVDPNWKVGLAGVLGSPVHFYEDEPHLLFLAGHLPVALYDEHVPFSAHAVHLLEDKSSVWSLSFPTAFEEIDHVADLAFTVRGETLEQLHYHALIALTFYEPQLLPAVPQLRKSDSLDAIIMHLNTLITNVDSEHGCAFKAVSFHGKINESNGILTWEMIIDV